MKVWKRLCLVALSACFASACTVTVGDGDGEGVDDEDLPIGPQQPFDGGGLDDETETETETETEPTSEPTPDASTDDGPATDSGSTDPTETETETEVPDASTDDTSTDTSTDEVPTDTGGEPDGGMCMLPTAEPGSCNACQQDECGSQYTACQCDEACSVQFASLQDCFLELHSADEPSAFPEEDWDLCFGEATGDMPSDLLYGLLDCIAEPFEPEADAGADPYDRAAGDGQCTFACFDLYSFQF
jgi:hypothetical protein